MRIEFYCLPEIDEPGLIFYHDNNEIVDWEVYGLKHNQWESFKMSIDVCESVMYQLNAFTVLEIH